MAATVQITESYKPALQRLWLDLHSEASSNRIGRDVVALVQNHFRELPSNERKFPSTHFWQRAAEATSYRVEEDNVVVSVDQVGIRQRYLGGDIKAISGKYLTIPAIAWTYGHSASEFDDLKVVRGHFITYWGRDVSLALVPSHWREDMFKPATVYFWLVQSVTQGPNSNVLPSDDAIFSAISEGIGERVDDLFSSSNDK